MCVPKSCILIVWLFSRNYQCPLENMNIQFIKNMYFFQSQSTSKKNNSRCIHKKASAVKGQLLEQQALIKSMGYNLSMNSH